MCEPVTLYFIHEGVRSGADEGVPTQPAAATRTTMKPANLVRLSLFMAPTLTETRAKPDIAPANIHLG